MAETDQNKPETELTDNENGTNTDTQDSETQIKLPENPTDIRGSSLSPRDEPGESKWDFTEQMTGHPGSPLQDDAAMKEHLLSLDKKTVVIDDTDTPHGSDSCMSEPVNNTNQMSLRSRDKDLDYKALATGRTETKEKKKGKRTTPKVDHTHKEDPIQEEDSTTGKTETPKERRGHQGQEERAFTLVDETTGMTGQGERALTSLPKGQDNTGGGKTKPRNNKRTNPGPKEGEKPPPSNPGTSYEREEEPELEIHPVHTEPPRKRKEKRKASSTESDSSSSSSSSSSSDSSGRDTPPRRTKRRRDSRTKKLLKEYKEYVKELEKANKKYAAKLDDKRSTLKKKESEITKQKKKYKELEGELRRTKEVAAAAEKEKERILDENCKLKEKLRKSEFVKEEVKQQKIEATRKLENFERLLRDSRKKTEESENLNKELLNKLTATRPSTHEKKTPSPTSLKLLFIGDSNSHRITPYLERRNKWDRTNDTYLIEDMEKVRSDTHYDAVIVLLGTNNIKKGADGKREAEKLVEQVGKFQQASHRFIVELPPINRRGVEIERRIFNNTLHNRNEDNKFKIIRMIKEVEESPIEQALHDDLHLTRENSKYMAAHIEKVVEKHVTDKSQTDKPQDQAKERRTRQGDQPEELEKERWQRNERTRMETKNIPCKFYRQDRCRMGSRCFYMHDKESYERTGRGRSTERRQSDFDRERRETYRSRSKSGDRRRVIISERSVIKPVEHE